MSLEPLNTALARTALLQALVEAANAGRPLVSNSVDELLEKLEGAQEHSTHLLEQDISSSEAGRRVESAQTVEAELEKLSSGFKHNLAGVLFPVRLEATYSRDGKDNLTLLVRVYPDDLSMDQGHSPAVTPEEIWALLGAWGDQPAPVITPEHFARWEASFGVNRAQWLLGQLATNQKLKDFLGDLYGASLPTWDEVPTGLLRPSSSPPPTTSPVMPDVFFWRATWISTHGRQEELTGHGLPVKHPVIVSPQWDHGHAEDTDNAADALYSGRAKWMMDFQTAVKQGMAFDIPVEERWESLDRLVVFGVSVRPEEAREDILKLFVAHAATEGLEFVQPSEVAALITEQVSSKRRPRETAREEFRTFFDVERGTLLSLDNTMVGKTTADYLQLPDSPEFIGLIRGSRRIAAPVGTPPVPSLPVLRVDGNLLYGFVSCGGNEFSASPARFTGAYGWLEHVKSDPVTRPNPEVDMVHTPSLSHVKHAVLLSHLAQRREKPIQFTAANVHGAMSLATAAKEGVPASLALGLELERTLSQSLSGVATAKGLELIQELRTAFPSATPGSSIVNGEALLTRFSSNPSDPNLWTWLQEVSSSAVNLLTANAELSHAFRRVLENQLAMVRSAGELSLAETMFHASNMNWERAAEAHRWSQLKSAPPSRWASMETRLDGISIEHQVGLAIPTSIPDTVNGWKLSNGLLSRMCPALSFWIATLLPSPTELQFDVNSGIGPLEVVRNLSAGSDDHIPTLSDAPVDPALRTRARKLSESWLELAAKIRPATLDDLDPSGVMLGLEERVQENLRIAFGLNATAIQAVVDLLQISDGTIALDGKLRGALGIWDEEQPAVTARIKQRISSVFDIWSGAVANVHDILAAQNTTWAGSVDSFTRRMDTTLVLARSRPQVTVVLAFYCLSLSLELELHWESAYPGRMDLRRSLARVSMALRESTSRMVQELLNAKTLPVGYPLHHSQAITSWSSLPLAKSVVDDWLTDISLVRPVSKSLRNLLPTANLKWNVFQQPKSLMSLGPVTWVATEWDQSIAALRDLDVARSFVLGHLSPPVGVSTTSGPPDGGGLLWMFLADAWEELVPRSSATTGLAFQAPRPTAQAPAAIALMSPQRWTISRVGKCVEELLLQARQQALSFTQKNNRF